MKIQDLPQPYRALAEMRRDQNSNHYFVNTFGFNWDSTPEKNKWWYKVWSGGNPEIPAKSLAELKEWQNKTMKLQKGQTIWAIDPCETPSGKKHLTVGKAYEIIEVTKMDVCVYVDTEQELFFLMDRFYTYFSLTPPHEVVLIAEQPKEENPFSGYEDKLFTAAVAAMQGMLFQNFQGSNEDMSNIAWDIAESLINEGKKRNLL